jgi:hypothetical protein
MGSAFLQCGHLQNIRDISMKIINKLTPVILKKVIFKIEPIKLLGIDKNKHNKENLRSFIRFFIFPIIIAPPTHIAKKEYCVITITIILGLPKVALS